MCGLILEATQGPAVHIEGGSHNRILGCTVRNAGAGIEIVSGRPA